MSLSLISVGPVVFSLAPLNPQKVKRSGGKTIFAEHEVLGATPPTEHTGFDNEELEIEGVLYPGVYGGAGMLEVIRAAKLAATPLPVMRGDGVPLGWFVIVENSEEHTLLDQGGVGREISVTLKLKSVGTPLAGAAAAIFSLFG